MNFIQVTRENGVRVVINLVNVSTIARLEGKTRITFINDTARKNLHVVETPEQILASLS